MSKPYPRLIDFLASGLYSGKCPYASGTAGSIAAWIISLPLFFTFPNLISFYNGSILAFIFTAFAIFIANEAVRLKLYGEDNKDPKQVVIDEYAGYLVSIVGLTVGYKEFLLGLLFFRIFDITKPPPARNLEKLPRGWGIVLDDVMAGVFANIAARICLHLFF